MSGNLLAHLKKLKKDGPHNVSGGICSNIPCNPSPLLMLFHKWPEFSGCISFPVPHPAHPDIDPHDAYMETENLWIGEYGEARMRLLDFCIEELEKEYE